MNHSFYFNFLGLLLFFTCCSSSQQIVVDSKAIEEHLTWNSFEINTTTYATIIEITDPFAQDLIKRGKNVTPVLLEHILDSEKGVAIHLILTEIWEPERFIVYSNYLYEENEPVKLQYMVNNLKWYVDLDTDVQSVNNEELLKIKEYWSVKSSQE